MLKIILKNFNFNAKRYCHDVKPTSKLISTRIHEYLTGNKQYKEINPSEITHLPADVLRNIDINLKDQLTKLSSDPVRVFNLIDNFYEEKPHLMTKIKATNDAINFLLRNLEFNFNKNDFLKLCFYLSIFKKNGTQRSQLQTLINRNLTKAMTMNLNSMDLAVLSLATYKASIRMDDAKFHNLIINEIITGKEDEFFIVNFIKFLRLNKVKSEKVLDKLKSLDYSKFNYHSLIHIIPYIADNKISDKELTLNIINRCIETFDDQVRVKDINKMLHSCALLNMKMNEDELMKIEDLIIKRVNHQEFENFFDHFVNSALCLWILNYKCIKLVKILLKDRRFSISKENKERIILDSRMKLLHTCIELECPKLVGNKKISFNPTRKSPSYLIKPSLERIMTERFKNHENAIFVQQILNLNISGILVTNNNKRIYYEVLDDLTSLSDQQPNGIFQLKLRLLKSKNCHFEVIKVE